MISLQLKAYRVQIIQCDDALQEQYAKGNIMCIEPQTFAVWRIALSVTRAAFFVLGKFARLLTESARCVCRRKRAMSTYLHHL